jgi:arylsulfatase A-like enzyme
VGVPLVLAGPGIPSGAVDDRFCYLQDVFPTLCDLAGLPVPASVEGRSLVAPAHDAGAGERDALYHAYCGVQRAVRVGDDKLIEYVTPVGRQTQLFDLRHDPHETMNVANEPAYALRRRELETMIAARPADARKERLPAVGMA